MDAWSDYVEWSGMDVSRLRAVPDDPATARTLKTASRKSGTAPLPRVTETPRTTAPASATAGHRRRRRAWSLSALLARA